MPGSTVEVIDLRTLAPYDWEAIARIGREDQPRDDRSRGLPFVGLRRGNLRARIADELFSSLDAPIGRVAALDTWVGYHPQLEIEILPQVENIVAEADRILSF